MHVNDCSPRPMVITITERYREHFSKSNRLLFVLGSRGRGAYNFMSFAFEDSDGNKGAIEPVLFSPTSPFFYRNSIQPMTCEPTRMRL